MPTLTLKLTPEPSALVLRALAQALTKVTAEVLHKRQDVTALVVEPLPASRWWMGGEPPTAPTAMLEIRITAGTNTDVQKARFVEAAHDVLQRHLAPHGALAEASYVVVHELPGTDWGYDGVTQRARRVARESSLSPAWP